MFKNETRFANSVFEQPWWLDIVAPAKWGEVTIERNGKTVARLPYVIEKGHIKMPPMTQTLGIWMDSTLKDTLRGNSHLNHQKEIIFELLDSLPRHKSISISLDHSTSYVLPFYWRGYRIVPFFSYRIENIKDIVNVDEQLASRTVRRIRAAERVVKVVIDNSDEGIESLLKLRELTFARQGRKAPGDINLHRRIMKESIENGCGQIMLAVGIDDGLPHSGAFFLYDEKVCYYLIGGQDPRYKSDGSQTLVLRRGIDLARRVSRDFDFEGSSVEGIENFFSQYGGKQIAIYRVIKQSYIADCLAMMKPRVKRIIGYKI